MGTLLFGDVAIFKFGHQRKPRNTNSITELGGVEQINFFFFNFSLRTENNQDMQKLQSHVSNFLFLKTKHYKRQH